MKKIFIIIIINIKRCVVGCVVMCVVGCVVRCVVDVLAAPMFRALCCVVGCVVRCVVGCVVGCVVMGVVRLLACGRLAGGGLTCGSLLAAAYLAGLLAAGLLAAAAPPSSTEIGTARRGGWRWRLVALLLREAVRRLLGAGLRREGRQGGGIYGGSATSDEGKGCPTSAIRPT